MVPPLKPLPGDTLICAVAKGPYVAATLATVGSGPRWYGLSAADADRVAITVAATATPTATDARSMLTSRRDRRAGASPMSDGCIVVLPSSGGRTGGWPLPPGG